MTDPVHSIDLPGQATAAATDAYAPTARPTSTFDKDMFLKLLVAQLKYQNPMSPTDPTQFMGQSAQFTMIEKLEELTAQGEARIVAEEIGTASALIGKQITYADPIDPDIELEGTVTSVQIDPVLPPVLKLADGTEVRLQDVKEVQNPSTS